MVQFAPRAVSSPGFLIQTREAYAQTGLNTVDALGLELGVANVRRAYIDVRDRTLDRELGISRWHMIEFASPIDITLAAERYRALPAVVEATPDYLALPAVVPSDPLHSDNWGHENTGQLLDYCWGCGGHDGGSPVGTPGFDADAEAAWDESQVYGSASIVIAILDSGVDIDHPDLRLVAGYDYGDNDSNPDDNSSQAGHGTACAGVAAAIANNGLGAVGIAGGCSVMPLKVANSAGSMYFSSIQNALYHAADNGADIASMSLGAAITSDPPTDTALQYAYNNGVVLLAATGNENASTISYPAVNQYVISVGAASPCGDRKRSSSNASEVNPGVNTDPNGYTCDGERWWGSNYGTTSQDAATAVDLLGPTILPTTDIGASGGYDSSDYYMWFNGTSCATPYVAGVAGLVLSANPSYTIAQVRDALVDNATDVVNVEAGTGWDRYSGYGLVNAAAAVGGGGPPQQDYTTIPYATGFESGTLDNYWATASTADGRVRILTTNTPHSGSYHLALDDATSGGFSQNEATLYLNLAGETQVAFDFWWKEFGDETHSQDGIYFSDDGGTSFTKVQDLNGSSYTNNTWQEFNLDLDQLAAANGLSLTATFVIKFQQYDNYPIATDGFAFDDIALTAGGTPSTITVTAPNGGETYTAGDNTSISWTWTGTFSNVSIDYSTNGGGNWTNITPSTPNDGSYTWTIPSSATTQGRVRVTDTSDTSVTDQSDGNFTIELPPSGDYATLPYTTGFEAGALDTYWLTQVTNDGRIRVLNTNTPHSGSYHLTMDDAVNGSTYSQTEAWLHLDLSGETEIDFDFWWKEFGDETHSQDGIYFSDNGGSSFTKVLDLNGASYTNNTWQEFNLDLDQLAASNGLSLSATFVIKLQQYDNYAMTSDGFAFDDISVAAGGGPPPGDYAPLPYATGFESGSLDTYWTTASPADGRVRILSTNTPHSGTYHLTMDDPTSGGYAQNEAWLHLDLAGETDVDLEFWWKEFGDETHSQDGVYFSDNGGSSFVKVQDLNGSSYTNNTWQQFTLDLDQLASSNGLSLSATFIVKFQQYDNYPIATDGHAYDDISVTSGGGASYITSETEPNGNSGDSNGPVGTGVDVAGTISSSSDDDWFWFDVATAGNINISVQIHSSADLDWFLYNSSLTEVARGYTVNNPEAGSYNASPGRYYLWVDGYQGATSAYTLSITGGLALYAQGPEKGEVPLQFALHQNVPNPVRLETMIQLDLPRDSDVQLHIYDASGRRVRTLAEGAMKPGSHRIPWDGLSSSGNPVASGIYFYEIRTDGFSARKKMSVIQ